MKDFVKIFLFFISIIGIISCGSQTVGTSSDVDIDIATLKGTVLTTDEKPVSGAIISLYSENDTIPLDSTLSGNNGGYYFHSVESGNYKVTASFGDSVAGIIQDIALNSKTDSLVELDTMWLVEPGAIGGSVLNYDGNGILFIYIPGTSFMATVDSVGEFLMTGVAPDSNYTIVYERYGFSKVTVSNITVTSGDTVYLEPQSLTPTMYPLNLKATYDSVINAVTLIWDKMQRDDIEGYVISRKDPSMNAAIPIQINSSLVKETFFVDTLHDTLFSKNDSISIQYQIQGQTYVFGERTGYSLPVVINAFINRDTSDYQSIIVTSPKLGDSLTGLYPYEITWNYTGKIDSVQIYLTLDDGARWNPISGKIKNQGKYDWLQVENAQSDVCQIKVVNSIDNSVIGISEQFKINLTPVENMLLNGDFENGFKEWIPGIHNYDTAVDANMEIENGVLHTTVNACDEPWKIGIYQYPATPIYSFYEYEISFKAKSTKPWKFYATIHTISGEYVHYTDAITSLDTSWTEYRLPLIPTGDPSGNNTVVSFAFGEELGEVWLDDVHLNIVGLR